MIKIIDDRGHTVHTVPTVEEAQNWIRSNEMLLLYPESLYRIKRVKEAKKCL